MPPGGSLLPPSGGQIAISASVGATKLKFDFYLHILTKIDFWVDLRPLPRTLRYETQLEMTIKWIFSLVTY